MTACCTSKLHSWLHLLQDATKGEPTDISAPDQATEQHHVVSGDQHQPAQPTAAGAAIPELPAAGFWAPAGGGHRSGSGPLLSTLSLSGLVSPMELEAGVSAAGAVDPLGAAVGLPGLWSGSNSRGTTPSSTTSSSGGRLQPHMDRQAPEPAMRVSAAPPECPVWLGNWMVFFSSCACSVCWSARIVHCWCQSSWQLEASLPLRCASSQHQQCASAVVTKARARCAPVQWPFK